MVPDLRPEGRRMLAGGQAQHGLLDGGCELAALENAQTPAVLGGSGILGELGGELTEVFSRHDPRVDVVGAPVRGLPAVLARARLGQEEDVARLEGKSSLQLLPVGVKVLVDVFLGHAAPEGAW